MHFAKAGEGMEMWSEGRGVTGTRAIVLFTLEMKLSPANLAFRKSLMLPPLLSLSLCFFPIVLKMLDPSSYKNIIVETSLNYLVRYFFGSECYRVMSNLSDDL